jgi:hypothetical protein
MLKALWLMSLSLTAFSNVPHFDLDMTTSEMKEAIAKAPKRKGMEDPAPITRAIKLGERLTQWLKVENDRRGATEQLQLTSPTLRRGIPIDKPSIYSDKTVEKDLNDLLAAMPSEMKLYFDNLNSEFPATLPVTDELFLEHGRKLSRVYQSAVRFRMLEPYRYAYTVQKKKDVRGYYFLTHNNWNATRLNSSDYETAESAIQTQIKNALIGMCINDLGESFDSDETDEARCANIVSAAVTAKDLGAVYTRFIAKAKKNWDSFYNIPNHGRRRDIQWSEANNTATVPFITPDQERIKNYLQVNIEEEWKWNGWQLKLNFGSFSSGPHVRFEAGVTPHVNGLGGDEIVMDANEPIEEYGSRWTIRHEFGHVLGFPDCYHEFYDTSLQAYVNYQLDITDLMCSRAGDMRERLFLEMKRVYANE